MRRQFIRLKLIWADSGYSGFGDQHGKRRATQAAFDPHRI